MSAVLKPKKSKSVRERVSREEWRMRADLAAAYQLAAIFKWTDLIYTHFSARLPGSEDFLINPYGLMFDEITASNLVKIGDEVRPAADQPARDARAAAGDLSRLRGHRARHA
jgi:ribulose-5-phosphate 4-epimerase/fuculose-1-phosphate aldolase